MSATERALSAGVVAAPDDDTPRLVLADWWEENAGEVECPTCKDSGKKGHVHRHGKHGPGYYPCPQCQDDDGYPTGRVSDGRRERGEFVRVQVELASAFHPPLTTEHWMSDSAGPPECKPGCLRCRELALRRRERKLLEWFCTEDLSVELGLPPHHSLYFTVSGWVCPLLGVELTPRRGFVESVSCDLATLIGGVCGRCDVAPGMRRYPTHGGDWIEDECNECSGTGRTPGIAPRLFASQPVTRVTVTDREPGRFVNTGQWYWVEEVPGTTFFRHTMPGQLFRAMGQPRPTPTPAHCYPTRAAALDALNAALVSYGRANAEGMSHEIECRDCQGRGVEDWAGSSKPARCLTCNGKQTCTRPGLPPLAGRANTEVTT